MKIAVNARHATGRDTGVPNYIRSLYQTIQALDSRNEYISFQTHEPALLPNTVYGWTPPGPLGDPWFDCWTTSRLAKRQHVDILHGPAHVLPLLKPRGTRYVLTVHDLSFHVFPSMYETHLRAYYGMVVGHSLKQADAIVADSLSTRDDIVRFYGIAPQSITVVPLGVDAIFRQPRSETRLIKNRYFLSLMTHQKRKNIDGVLTAIANTPELRVIQYVIAGAMSQEHFDQIGAKVVALGLQNCVRLYGHAKKEDLVNLYQNAEFFIYPSFYEGFGLPVLEAMSCGCPVITSNNSSLREIVPDSSWLVDPQDPVGMGAAMTRLLGLSTEARGQHIADGQQFASTFTWERCARSMIGVFHQTASQGIP